MSVKQHLERLSGAKVQLKSIISKEDEHMKKIIKNGTIVTATDTYQAEILIENGKITKLARIFLHRGRGN